MKNKLILLFETLVHLREQLAEEKAMGNYENEELFNEVNLKIYDVVKLIDYK